MSVERSKILEGIRDTERLHGLLRQIAQAGSESEVDF
jgi:hypothetical protein